MPRSPPKVTRCRVREVQAGSRDHCTSRRCPLRRGLLADGVGRNRLWGRSGLTGNAQQRQHEIAADAGEQGELDARNPAAMRLDGRRCKGHCKGRHDRQRYEELHGGPRLVGASGEGARRLGAIRGNPMSFLAGPSLRVVARELCAAPANRYGAQRRAAPLRPCLPAILGSVCDPDWPAVRPVTVSGPAALCKVPHSAWPTHQGTTPPLGRATRCGTWGACRYL